MSEISQAHLPDLVTIASVYPDDKRLTVTVPERKFSALAVAVGDEVELFERPDGIQGRRPHYESGRVRGRVKRLLVEVEIDLATYNVPVSESQGQLR